MVCPVIPEISVYKSSVFRNCYPFKISVIIKFDFESIFRVTFVFRNISRVTNLIRLPVSGGCTGVVNLLYFHESFIGVTGKCLYLTVNKKLGRSSTGISQPTCHVAVCTGPVRFTKFGKSHSTKVSHHNLTAGRFINNSVEHCCISYLFKRFSGDTCTTDKRYLFTGIRTVYNRCILSTGVSRIKLKTFGLAVIAAAKINDKSVFWVCAAFFQASDFVSCSFK